MISYAVGPLALKPNEFWALTWADYYRLCEGERLRSQRAWEQTRYIACTIRNVYSTRIIGPSEIIYLDLIDGKKKQTVNSEPIKTHYTKEEMRELQKRFGINPDGKLSGA